ncbi:histone deacetylase [Synechococcus sp. PCC 7502]|uniref:histone deacetylase family protein n=1 Tax=Synechococcus sp. PCC 7502 TaxID=1173263 RepID=UPI00059E6FC2|nr:histone deacetylase [Synechococcus sp. PCC 7502]
MQIIYSDEFLEHLTGAFHPEKPERLTAITTALKTQPWSDRLQWQQPQIRDLQKLRTEIEKCHSSKYIDQVKAISAQGHGMLDADTVLSQNSYQVAQLAVSAWLDGVDQVLKSDKPVFILSRPPGHHAVRDSGMGFCIFNNGAIAANYALEQYGVERVAILDWDVHHGNGTQDIVWNQPQIAYISIHQAPFYPGTGWQAERGGHENILNLPLPSESAIATYLPVFTQRVIPFLQDFKPDLLIISAGFDANSADPLASMNLQPQDYGVFTELCLGVTSRILLGLEGGYEFQSLSQSVVAVVEKILDN